MKNGCRGWPFLSVGGESEISMGAAIVPFEGPASEEVPSSDSKISGSEKFEEGSV